MISDCEQPITTAAVNPHYIIVYYPSDSTWPVDPPVGSHLTRQTLTVLKPPQKGRTELPGYDTYYINYLNKRGLPYLPYLLQYYSTRLFWEEHWPISQSKKRKFRGQISAQRCVWRLGVFIFVFQWPTCEAVSAVKLGEALKVREVAEGKGSDEQKGCLMPSELKYITQLIWLCHK